MRRFSFGKLITADLVSTRRTKARRRARTLVRDPWDNRTTRGASGFSGPVSRPNLVMLNRTMSEPNWQDSIDEENGLFVYFGDNRKPVQTPRRRACRGGNQILPRAFELADAGPESREQVPAFLDFSKGARGRDAVFRGLAAPGRIANHAELSLAARRFSSNSPSIIAI